MLKYVLAVIFFGFSIPAAAWDNRGHRLTGELAYDRLQMIDPAAVQAVVVIMSRHPDRARFDRNLTGVSGTERTRRLFGLMARWPDHVRGAPWDRPEWHYALKVVHGWTWLDWYTAGDAEKEWAANLATARDPLGCQTNEIRAFIDAQFTGLFHRAASAMALEGKIKPL